MDTTLHCQTLYRWCHTVVTTLVDRLLSKDPQFQGRSARRLAAIFSQQSIAARCRPAIILSIATVKSKLNALVTADQCWMTAFYDVSINSACLSILTTISMVSLPVMVNRTQMTLSLLHQLSSQFRLIDIYIYTLWILLLQFWIIRLSMHQL